MIINITFDIVGVDLYNYVLMNRFYQLTHSFFVIALFYTLFIFIS